MLSNYPEGALAMKRQSTDLSRVATVGLDIAKNIFCAHAVDTEGQVVLTRVLRRNDLIRFFQSLPRCLVGIEACGSSHYWGRELLALGSGLID
jgi:transposase